MSLPDDVAKIEAELKAIGKTPTELCREAGIAHTTFMRWRDGTFEPTLKNWRAVEQALQRLKTSPPKIGAPGEGAAA